VSLINIIYSFTSSGFILPFFLSCRTQKED
jgi:hypothetical protein